MQVDDRRGGFTATFSLYGSTNSLVTTQTAQDIGTNGTDFTKNTAQDYGAKAQKH